MIIRFNAPPGDVPEWLVEDMQQQLIELYHTDKNISAATVSFKRQFSPSGRDHDCEIDLTLYGNSLMVSRSGKSYTRAAAEALEEISVRAKEIMKHGMLTL